MAVKPKQVTKRCHWVPQVYLRGFSATPNGEKIWRYGPTSGDPELKSIEKVAVKFHLYVRKLPDGSRDDSLEQKLADLEQWFASPIWSELQKGFVDLSQRPVRLLVSLLAATMFLRNPKHYDITRNIYEQLVSMGLEDDSAVGNRIDPSPLQIDDGGQKRFWMDNIRDAAWFAEQFMAMRWSILSSDDPVFITTDNPVCFLHPSLSFRGIANTETSVLFPLSPTRLLSFDNRMSEPANRYYPLKGSAAPHNLLLWRHAIEHMFTHRHPDLVSAELVECEEAGGLSAEAGRR